MNLPLGGYTTEPTPFRNWISDTTGIAVKLPSMPILELDHFTSGKLEKSEGIPIQANYVNLSLNAFLPRTGLEEYKASQNNRKPSAQVTRMLVVDHYDVKQSAGIRPLLPIQ